MWGLETSKWPSWLTSSRLQQDLQAELGPQHKRRLAVQATEGLRLPRAPHASAPVQPGTAQAAAGLGLLGSGVVSSAPGLLWGRGGGSLERVVSSAPQSPLLLYVPRLLRAGSLRMETQTHPPWRNAWRSRGRLRWRETTRGRRVSSRRCLQRSDGDPRPDVAKTYVRPS